MNTLKITTAAAMLACATLAAQAAGISDDKVKIGVLTDMSGQYADSGGKGSVEAAKMAIEDFGGKVQGKPIELVFADHQNKADIGGTKARQWQQGRHQHWRTVHRPDQRVLRSHHRALHRRLLLAG